VRRLRTAPTR